ncbi:hypothetical protein LXL04_025131 [Taraxacum kok-saghyz]
MNKMMTKLQRFGRIKQLHIIISQETIRPSSPTPPHLKTHNLSLPDQFALDIHTQFVFFYQNYKKHDTKILKRSLSKCLTHYFPFAGRIPTPLEPYINCNDEGVEFLEAFNDTPLHDFIHVKVEDEFIDQLFPYGLISTSRASCPKLLDVQFNHFAGDRATVALSMSHKLADAATISNFINHWAAITRYGSPINPVFISSSRNHNIRVPKFTANKLDKVNYATRRFVFSNSKRQELKNQVIAMRKAPMNPTRVEVLTSLIFKHAVRAGTRNSGSIKPSNLSVTVNMRNKLVEKYPETVAWNLFTLGIVNMADSGDFKLGELISKIRNAKMDLEGVQDEKEVVEKLGKIFSTLQGDVYYSSSVCRVPFFEADFRWGKPVAVRIRFPNVDENGIILMDSASGDGIVAQVHLSEKEMAILENDKEFLIYVRDV